MKIRNQEVNITKEEDVWIESKTKKNVGPPVNGLKNNVIRAGSHFACKFFALDAVKQMNLLLRRQSQRLYLVIFFHFPLLFSAALRFMLSFFLPDISARLYRGGEGRGRVLAGRPLYVVRYNQMYPIKTHAFVLCAHYFSLLTSNFQVEPHNFNFIHYFRLGS